MGSVKLYTVLKRMGHKSYISPRSRNTSAMRLVSENARECIINIKENRKLAKSQNCTFWVEVTCRSIGTKAQTKEVLKVYIYTNGTRLGRVSVYIEPPIRYVCIKRCELGTESCIQGYWKPQY